MKLKFKAFSVVAFAAIGFMGCRKSLDNDFDAQKFECGSDFGSRDGSLARVVRFVHEGGRKLLEPEARKLLVKLETKGGSLETLKVSSGGCVDAAQVPNLAGYAQAELGDLSARLQGADLEALPQTMGGVSVVRLNRDSHRLLCGTLNGKLLDPALPTVKLLTPEGGELPEKTLSAISFSVQRGVLSKLTPRGCLQVQSHSGIHFTARGPGSSWMASFHAENAGSILTEKVLPLKLKSVETVTARLDCPTQGLLSNAMVTVPFALESRGDLEGASFFARIKNLEDGKARATTKETPLAGSAYRIEIDPALLGSDGRYGVELELRDGFGRAIRMERASECQVTLDRTAPAVPTLANLGGLESAQSLTLQDGASIEFDFPAEGIPLSCVTPDDGTARICVPDRTGGRTTKVGVTGKPQELHCASSMDAAGNLSLPRCVQVHIDRVAPEFEVSWDVPHLNENQGTWRGPLKTTSATIRLHAGSDDTTSESGLLDSLQCRVSFVDEKGGARPADFVRCLNGKCQGLLLRDFTPCDATLSFQVDEPENRIANSYVVLEARIVDASGRATVKKRSFRNVPLEQAFYMGPRRGESDTSFQPVVTLTRDADELSILVSSGILGISVGLDSYLSGYSKPTTEEVTSMTADTEDRLWMGTHQGLFQDIYGDDNEAKLEPAVPQRAVTALHSDASGTVWVAFGKKVHSKPVGGTWQAVSWGPAPRTASPIVGFEDAANGHLLSWREDGTIERSVGGDDFEKFPRPSVLPGGRTWRNVFEDRSKNLVALADGFLCRKSFSSSAGEEPWECQEVPEGRALGVIESDDGVLFVAVESQGLLARSRGQWRRVDGPGKGVDCIRSPFFERAPNGDAWCADGETVIRFNVNEMGQISYTDTNSALRNNHISSLLLSKDGHIFSGIGDQGLARLEDTGWTHSIAGYSGLLGKEVNAIQEAPNGDKWVSTLDGGISRWSGSQWQTYQVTRMGSATGGSFRLAIDSNGSPWVGTIEEGIFGFDGTKWLAKPLLSDSPEDRLIYTMAPSANGGMWFGTQGGGLGFIDSQGTVQLKERMSGIVTKIFEDSKGRLWVGLESGSLVMFHQSDRRDFFMMDPHGFMQAGYISAITETDEGKIIAAAAMLGVGVLDVESGAWSFFDKDSSGLPRDQYVKELIPTPTGQLWIGGFKGLVRIDPEFIPGQK